ncbi:hypothetical protein Tco_0561436 [Tanacetum coccineum]
MDKRKKHFARLTAEEHKRKSPTKAQKRNQMCTYLKNMAGFTHSQLKNKSFDEIQKAFDKTMGWIDSFVSIDSEVVKEDDDQEEAKMKKHMEIIVDEEEIAVDAIPLATKPPIINIDKEDLETLWKLVKAKHGNTRPEEAYEKSVMGITTAKRISTVRRIKMKIAYQDYLRDTATQQMNVYKPLKGLQQGESLNVQDVNDQSVLRNLKFTSEMEKSMES